MIASMLADQGAAPGRQGGPPPPPIMIFFSVLMVLMILLRNYAGSRRHGGVVVPKKDREADRELPAEYVDLLARDQPTAVFLVGSKIDVGSCLLKPFSELYGKVYCQVLFLAVGQLTEGLEQSSSEARKSDDRITATKRLRIHVRLALDPYLAAARNLGFRCDCRISLAANPAGEICRLAEGVVRTYPRVMFFVGKLVAERTPWYRRILPARPEDGLRESLERRGIPVTVLPVILQGSTADHPTRNLLSA